MAFIKKATIFISVPFTLDICFRIVADMMQKEQPAKQAVSGVSHGFIKKIDDIDIFFIRMM